MPLRQWFYFDALECLAEEEDQLAESSFSAVSEMIHLFEEVTHFIQKESMQL